MANYYGSGRSNYVAVTDLEKVKKLASLYGCEVSESSDDPSLICLLSNTEEGDTRSWVFVSDEEIPIIKEVFPKLKVSDEDNFELPDFMKSMSKYLKNGHVFIWMSCGQEKLRYLNGYACAINNKGRRKQISIYDIYKLAKPLGKHITAAEY